MKQFLLFISIVSGYFSSQAQEKVSALKYNSALLHQQYITKQNPSSTSRSRALDLPFFDDFSLKGIYPQASLWTDSFVYINDHLQKPELALSYGVATFDCFNKFGRPYNTTTPNAYGTADTLTSQPIDLSVYPQTDTSVYLSFWYAPEGLGDWPDQDDSLILEGKTLNTWKILWATGGYIEPPGETPFKKVIIQINDPFFFVSDFQFRFRNLGSSGQNDHWHIDYLYLDAGRDANDTVDRDISVINIPSRILKNYTAMPWNQFVDNQATEIDTSFNIFYRNNFDSDKNMPFTYDVQEVLSATNLDAATLSLSPFTPFSYFNKQYNTQNFIPLSSSNDSVLLRIRQSLDPNVGGQYTSNDTSWRDIPFYNYFAYDDGSAELAYGLEGPGLKKFAYEFNLNKPDTLRAVQIHFNYINEDVSNLLFTMFVWDNIDFNTKVEDTLYKEDFLEPYYYDSINSFATYLLKEPIALEEGSFFLGWQQIDERNLQIGLDVNNSAQSKIHVFANGSWVASSVQAAPMIRAVVGKQVKYKNVVSVEEKSKLENVTVYPNPSNDYINVSVSNQSIPLQVTFFDLAGKLIKTETVSQLNNSISIIDLENGTYLLKIAGEKGTQYQPKRFVKLN